MPTKLAIRPWPRPLTPEWSKFSATAESIYLDFLTRGASKNVALAFLANAELVSGLNADQPGGLYGKTSPIEEGPLPDIAEQNAVAWEQLEESRELGLRHVLTATSAGEAARTLAQYWIRPSDHDDLERVAMMADRWIKQGNLG